MNHKTSFAYMLRIYTGGGRNFRNRKWWFRLWLFFKGKAYRQRRLSILEKQCEIRSYIRFAAASRAPCFFEKHLKNYNAWKGGTYHVPLNYEP